MIRIGLTGGIGSGKSVIARLFEIMGIPVFYADSEAKYLMRNDVNLKRELTKLLGSEAYNGPELNRRYIAQKVFNDREMLDDLNKIVHPAVRNHFERWCENYSAAKMVVQEAAILFENGSYTYFDKNILVVAPEKLRINRVTKRDGVDEKLVRDRIANQWKDEEKIKLADFVVTNDEEQLLIVQLNEIFKNI